MHQSSTKRCSLTTTARSAASRSMKGWVHYNQFDFKSAMATFIDVIDFATRRSSN